MFASSYTCAPYDKVVEQIPRALTVTFYILLFLDLSCLVLVDTSSIKLYSIYITNYNGSS